MKKHFEDKDLYDTTLMVKYPENKECNIKIEDNVVKIEFEDRSNRDNIADTINLEREIN